MLFSSYKIFQRLFVLLVLSLVMVAASDAQTYSHLNVKGRVRLEIPSDWTVSDSEQRKKITEWSEKISGLQNLHVASLSAQSFPAPSKMFVRVSFVKMDYLITQTQLQKEVSINRQGFLREVEDAWNSESPAMWSALSKTGVKAVGKPNFSIEPLGGQMAIVIKYVRTSVGNPNEVVNVAQYQILLGEEKAMITLSVVGSDTSTQVIHDRIKASFSIQ